MVVKRKPSARNNCGLGSIKNQVELYTFICPIRDYFVLDNAPSWLNTFVNICLLISEGEEF